MILIIQFSAIPAEKKNLVDKIRFINSNSQINKEFSEWNVDAQFWVINIMLGSIKIVTSILIIQAGIRMFVSEFQQSFQGISEKLVPEAVMAVDAVAMYGFSINSVTYVFISETIAQYLAVGVLAGLSKASGGVIPVAIPLFITLFFNSVSIGLYANASGGYKAAIIIPALFGFFEVLMIAFGIFALRAHAGAINSSDSFPFRTGFLGMFDWNFFFGLSLLVVSWTKELSIIIFAFVTPILLVLFSQIIDSNRQSKITFMQRLFKVKVNLLTK